MFYPQPPSVISNLNSLFLFTSTLRATTSSPFTSRRLEGEGRLGCLFNLRPLSVAIGVSCKESWSRVELGRHFILVTGMSAPQDQTSCSLASQR
ncbi:hypothetical protein CsSME_00015980 [Camellia sinensis var. sinensis]